MRKLWICLLLLSLIATSGCYSCKTMNRFWGKGPVPPECEDMFFWDKDCVTIAEMQAETVPPPPPPAPKPAPAPKPTPVKPATSACGPSSARMEYPCDGCGIVKIEKMMPGEVQLNAPFDYTVMATNVTDTDVVDIVVVEHLPANFKFVKTSTPVKQDGNKLMWTIGKLASDETARLVVTGMATNTNCLTHCSTVTYVVPTCANVAVVEPKLKLVKTAPAEVLLCDPIPVRFVVTNTGTGAAQNVTISDTLPVGLQTGAGKNSLSFDAGTLDAGQSREFTATLRAEKTGSYVNKAVAQSASGLKAEAQSTTVVRQPILTITKTAPEMRYLGRDVSYVITVANKGDAPARELMVEDQLPAGVDFVSASNGGRASGGKVRWSVDALAPGQSMMFNVTVMPKAAGTFTNRVAAEASCAAGVTASVQTVIAGIPAILLEVIDLEDPVEIGQQTTYVIKATNQGTAPGTNIKIVCVLEDNEQYVSSGGVTPGSVDGKTITFAPLASLATKDAATWRVVVKAVKAGDVRFTVIMNTDELTRPVQETEATHLYE